MEAIRAASVTGRFDFTEHAAHRAVELRNILTTVEPNPVGAGVHRVGRPLHIQAADSPSPTVRTISLYEPDPAEWEDYERRRWLYPNV